MNIKQLKALVSQDLMYELYYKLRNSQWASQRQTALAAKTYGIIYWDRVMFQKERIAKLNN